MPEGKVFLSWSGKLSQELANIFKEFMKKIFGTDNTFLSCKDIEMGENWASRLSNELKKNDFGIIFVTRDNVSAPWLFFEAGALAEKKKSRVIPFYLGIKRDDMFKTPFFLQQSVAINELNGILDEIAKEEIIRTLSAIEKALEITIAIGLNELCKKNWGWLESKLGAIGNKYPPTVQIEGIRYETMNRLLKACEDNYEAIFFNVQVDVSSWFNPYMQIHLAMHDSASRKRQLTELLKAICSASKSNVTSIKGVKQLGKYFGTPASRIMFIAERETKLKNGIKDPEGPYRQLIELILIHLLMSIPLAIITLDDFVEIAQMDQNRSFFADPSTEEILCLPNKIVEVGVSDAKACNVLKTALNKMKLEPGKITRSIDFAVFRDDDGNIKDVWGGSFDDDLESVYFLITENLHIKTKRRNNFEYHDGQESTFTLRSSGIKEGYRDKLEKFSEIITAAVFEDKPEKSAEYHYQSANDEITKIFNNLSPVLKAFNPPRKWHGDHLIRQIKRRYSPFETFNELDAMRRLTQFASK